MKNKKIIIVVFLIFAIIILILYYKKQNSGNNTNRSIKDYILNISSYEATIEVEIYSNKNTNKYILKQWYTNPNIFKQEVQGPENIKGLTIVYDGVNLKIENSRLNLAKIYNNYHELSSNILSLKGFIDRCQSTEIICSETENEIIMEILDKDNKCHRLTIDRVTREPMKMEIMDKNKNILVYILYNEITINNTTKEDII